MTIAEIIACGAQQYTHHYMRTMLDDETVQHTLDVPSHLSTLAKRNPDAQIIEFGDFSLGIEIDGKLWAAEIPHQEMRPAKGMPHEVWQYIRLAMGGNGDTNSR